LEKSFLELTNCKKPRKITKLQDWGILYLTRKSIVKNFESLFKYPNDSLAVRFYNLLADGYNMR